MASVNFENILIFFIRFSGFLQAVVSINKIMYWNLNRHIQNTFAEDSQKDWRYIIKHRTCSQRHHSLKSKLWWRNLYFPPEHQKMLYNRFYNPCIQSHLDVFSVPFSINMFDFVYFQFLITGCSAAVSSQHWKHFPLLPLILFVVYISDHHDWSMLFSAEIIPSVCSLWFLPPSPHPHFFVSVQSNNVTF